MTRNVVKFRVVKLKVGALFLSKFSQKQTKIKNNFTEFNFVANFLFSFFERKRQIIATFSLKTKKNKK
jgi:hypothetical protein